MIVIEKFEIDLVQAISDPYRETTDFGAEIEFPDDDMPISKNPLLKAPEDLPKLSKPSPYTGKRMSDRLEAIRVLREQVGGEYPVMGWVEGALAEAANLRSVNSLMLDLYNRPEWVGELCSICEEVSIHFAKAQIEAGADIIGLGDAVGSLINPKMYRHFALPYEQRIFETVHEMGAKARLHICGNTSKILDAMVESGADIIDLDYMVDMESAAARYGNRVSFCGNFDPVAVLLQGSPEDVYRASTRCMEIGGPRAFSAGGCEVPMGTPDENLHAQSQALRDFGRNLRKQ
jgi:MtaA/CmuA family methyltransferase